MLVAYPVDSDAGRYWLLSEAKSAWRCGDRRGLICDPIKTVSKRYATKLVDAGRAMTIDAAIRHFDAAAY